MKKILLLMILCIGFVGLSSESYAQSTQINPFNGATHTYGFANIEGNASYEFYVSTSSDYTDASAVITTFGSFVGAVDIQKGDIAAGGGDATVQIKWADIASTLNSGNGVYLFLKVTAQGDPCGGPGNYKAVHIKPKANDFNIAIVATPDENPICADLSALKPVINLTDFNATDEYDSGTTNLTYTVTRTPGTGNNWDSDISIACSDASVNYSYSVNTTAPTTGTGDGTIELRNVSQDDLTVTVTVINTPGTNPVFSLNLLSGSDLVTLLTDLTVYTDDGDDTNDDADTKASHIIKLMPKIGDFIPEL